VHEYMAPLADMKFVLTELADRELLARLPGFQDVTLDVAEAVLDATGNAVALCPVYGHAR